MFHSFRQTMWSNVHFGANLSSKTLKCHISLMIYYMYHHCFRQTMWWNVRFGGNLSSKTLKCQISLMIYCMYHRCKWLALLRERASMQWPITRALQKQLQVFTEKIQIRSLLVFLAIHVPISLYLSIFLEWNAWDFTLSWPRFLETSRRLRRFPTNFRRLPNDSRTLLKTKCPQFRRLLSTYEAT